MPIIVWIYSSFASTIKRYMISYFKGTKTTVLHEVDGFTQHCWVAVEDPHRKEIEALVGLGLDRNLLKDALDENEVPRIEIKDEVTYIFSRIPYEYDGVIETIPVLFGFAEKFVFTLVKHNDILMPDIEEGEEEIFLSTVESADFLIKMFAHVNSRFDSFLQKISRQVRASSKNLNQISNKDVLRFVVFEQTLNDFLSALVPIRANLEKILMDKNILSPNRHDFEFFHDLELEVSQLIDISRSSVRNIISLRDAYSTILTNNLNRVIKALTAFTVILTIPTMIASFYGMNVVLPFAENPNAFTFIALWTGAFVLVILIIFAWRKWL